LYDLLYLDDGRLEMDTNVVERAIRPVTSAREDSLFAGFDAGARRWAIANTLIQTCKLNGVEPLAYVTDILQRIVSGRTKPRPASIAVVELALVVHGRRRTVVGAADYLAASSPRQSDVAVATARRLHSTLATNRRGLAHNPAW
jgi:hypothetical protein